ncbi:MAG: heme ABC transporter ATP-binding protein [Bernardetiaceae bacterium]
MFVVSDVSKKIKNKHLLQGCSLQLSPGQLTAVVGPNGAGKSTLLKIMSGETKTYQGSVQINQKPLHTYNSQSLSKVRAILPQQSFVNFPFTVAQIVSIGRYAHPDTPPDQNQHIVEQVLQYTDLLALKDRNYQSLSGGEQQRAQMARLMAQLHGNSNTPRYALLDEPTASLDIAQQHRLLRLARGLCRQQIGVLAILHDLNLALQYADQILFLRQGRVVAYGQTQQTVSEQVIETTFAYPVRLMQAHGRSFVIPSD